MGAWPCEPALVTGLALFLSGLASMALIFGFVGWRVARRLQPAQPELVRPFVIGLAALGVTLALPGMVAWAVARGAFG